MAVKEPFEFFFQWHLTERCNLRCRHCYQSAAGGPELTLREIRETAAEARAMVEAWEELYEMAFARSCNVAGGEPFLRKDLFTILEHLDGEGFSLYLLTNGTLIDDRRANDLAALGVKGVQVSIEGTERVHDGIRGRGNFRAAIQGVERLLAAGLAVTLNVTLSRLNAACLEGMIEMASELGVPRVGFSRLVPAGRGEGLLAQMLEPEDVRSLYKKLFSLSITGLEIVTGDPVAWQMRQPANASAGCTPHGGCAAGVSGLTLMADGTILPCRRLEISLGNVRTHSIREVWATSEVLNHLRTRELYQGGCGNCPRWADCRGCRAIAYACSQAAGNPDYLAEDPQCFIQ